MTNSKKPIVFIPGLTCDGDILFEHQIRTFRELGHEVIVIDNTKAATNQELVKQIFEKVKEKSHFVGLSAGGYAIFEMFRQNPALADRIVDKIASLSTSARADTKESIAARHTRINRAENNEYMNVADELHQIMVHPDHKNDSKLFAKLKTMAEKVGILGFVNQMKQILTRGEPETGFLDILPKINKNVLVMVGDKDPLFPPDIAQEIVDGINKNRGSADLHIIKDCGHLSSMEQPEEVTKGLKGFLAVDISKKI